MTKFERVLSDDDLLGVYRSLDNPKRDRDSVIEAMGAAVDAAMRKLAEQEPVAWVAEAGLKGAYILEGAATGAFRNKEDLLEECFEAVPVPLYTHPMPCVSHASDKAACVSEKVESDRQLARQQPCGCVICYCENQERCLGCGAKYCGTHDLWEIPNPVYVDHIADASKMVDAYHIPDIGQMITPLAQRKIQTLLDKGEYRAIENATVLVNGQGHAAIVNRGGAFYWVDNEALAREFDGVGVVVDSHHIADMRKKVKENHIPDASKMVADMYWMTDDWPQEKTILGAINHITGHTSVRVGELIEVGRAKTLPPILVEISELGEDESIKNFRIVGGDHIPDASKMVFDPDAALTLAERTLNIEIIEPLADELIQFARKLYEKYAQADHIPEAVKMIDDAYEALYDALDLVGLDISAYSSPKEALAALIDWHVSVATDSRTNGGYQLIPVKPTEEMYLAARDWSVKKYGKAIGLEASHGCYKAMLAAAPKFGDKQ